MLVVCICNHVLYKHADNTGDPLINYCFTAPASISQNHNHKYCHILHHSLVHLLCFPRTNSSMSSALLLWSDDYMQKGQQGGQEGSLPALCRQPICSQTLPLIRCWIIKIKIEKKLLWKSPQDLNYLVAFPPTAENKRLSQSIRQEWTCDAMFLLNFLHVSF